MNGYYFIIIGVAMAGVGGILATQGWNMVKQREEAFSLAVAPSLEITLQPGKTLGDSQTILFHNTGQHVLLNLEIY